MNTKIITVIIAFTVVILVFTLRNNAFINSLVSGFLTRILPLFILKGRSMSKRLNMIKIREILRLRFAADLSVRQIARSQNLSTGVVSKYIQRAQEHNKPR